MLLNGLLLLVASNFETDGRIVKRRLECFSEEVLHVCVEERSHTVSLQKFIDEIHLFSIVSDPAFTEANKALEHLQKTSEKRATLLAY